MIVVQTMILNADSPQGYPQISIDVSPTQPIEMKNTSSPQIKPYKSQNIKLEIVKIVFFYPM